MSCNIDEQGFRQEKQEGISAYIHRNDVNDDFLKLLVINILCECYKDCIFVIGSYKDLRHYVL